MTALDRYVRLESDALWRAGPDAQRRDVTISFGDATLVIADGAGRPLAHWSLPALIRQNPDEAPAVYAPDDEASELLEISDISMVEAIEEVRKALAKSRPHPGKLRHWLTAGVVTATLALAVFWLPGALTRQTLSVVPDSKRAEIGSEMLVYLQDATGVACQSPRATPAAARLAQRLLGPDTQAEIIVVADLPQAVVSLPGDLIVLDYAMLQSTDDPAVAAGFILAAQTAAAQTDPLEQLLKQAGLRATFRLLTTGDIPGETLRRLTGDLLQNNRSAPDPERLRAAFAAVQIPQAPYVTAVDARTGTMPDLGVDPLAGQEFPLILSDGDWVSLQNICNI